MGLTCAIALLRFQGAHDTIEAVAVRVQERQRLAESLRAAVQRRAIGARNLLAMKEARDRDAGAEAVAKAHKEIEGGLVQVPNRVANEAPGAQPRSLAITSRVSFLKR